MYEKDYFFRYGDLDRSSSIKISAVLDVLQDVSTAHSLSAGYSLEKIYSSSAVLVLRGWRIRFLEGLEFSEKAAVKTGIMSVRGFEGTRKYEIHQRGSCKIVATALWICLDVSSRKIIPIPEEMKRAYGNINEEDNSLPFLNFRSKADLPVVYETKAEERDIDTNGHMNNAKSVEAALEFLEKDFNISELQITYKKEILKGERIKICTSPSNKEQLFKIINENGDLCVGIKAEKM